MSPILLSVPQVRALDIHAVDFVQLSVVLCSTAHRDQSGVWCNPPRGNGGHPAPRGTYRILDCRLHGCDIPRNMGYGAIHLKALWRALAALCRLQVDPFYSFWESTNRVAFQENNASLLACGISPASHGRCFSIIRGLRGASKSLDDWLEGDL